MSNHQPHALIIGAGAIGSLLIVAYALLCVSKWDWETLPRLVVKMLKMMVGRK